jgi:hypothetical protein
MTLAFGIVRASKQTFLKQKAEVYTQSASESMNRVLKEEDQDCNNTGRAKKSVCDIVERFRKVVKRQEQEQFVCHENRRIRNQRTF